MTFSYLAPFLLSVPSFLVTVQCAGVRVVYNSLPVNVVTRAHGMHSVRGSAVLLIDRSPVLIVCALWRPLAGI